jgi:hypothetical protein
MGWRGKVWERLAVVRSKGLWDGEEGSRGKLGKEMEVVVGSKQPKEIEMGRLVLYSKERSSGGEREQQRKVERRTRFLLVSSRLKRPFIDFPLTLVAL